MRPRTPVPRRPRRLLILPLLGLGLALASGASAREGLVGSFPVSLTVADPCTGEEVAVEGVVHFVGGDHFRYDLSGVDADGTAYRIFSVDNEGSAPSPAVSVHTAASTFRLVREGGRGDDDFVAHGVVHLTMNANGELTADFGKVRTRCT